ncbi:MAG: hypothetical protein AB8W78_13165 [Arsenophonus endosymbiont of Dermacentor nuttalli]
MKNNFLLMLFILIVITAFPSVSSNRESMHGFIYTPKNRAVLCWMEQNKDCAVLVAILCLLKEQVVITIILLPIFLF